MQKILLFPGQGAQKSGMGQELYNSCGKAKEIFNRLEAVRKGTIKQCFFGTADELKETINAQPCIFAVSVANAYSLIENGFSPTALVGFSVGEVAALTVGGVFSLEDGFRAVIKRAELMAKAAAKTKGTMAAVLRLEAGEVERISKENGVYPVNYNCPGQTVVSGEVDKMPKFIEVVAKAGGRAMPLAVSGAFHSPLMTTAATEFRKHLDTTTINPPKTTVYSNVTAKEYGSDIKSIKDLLASQIASPVLFQQIISGIGKAEYLEVEPGKVLTNLISKIVV